MILGVVADDLTGATDAGSMSARAGHLTHVYAHDHFEHAQQSAVCVLDTDSRLDDAKSAYRKAYRATKDLESAGAERFHKKTCSVFRGNVGPEFDAMLDALGEEFAVVALGFPQNGRTTVDGVHYVHGVRLEDSPFRNDPVHPTLESRLTAVLGAQTPRRVASLGHALVASGEAALAKEIDAARAVGGYLIVDVVDQAALRTIAAAVNASNVRVMCGASALIEELALTWPRPLDPGAATRPAVRRGGANHGPDGVLVIAGSVTPQTVTQVTAAAESGIRQLVLDTRTVFSATASAEHVAELACEASGIMARGGEVLVHADNRPEAVQSTQAEGRELGHDRAATGRLVSQALAEVAAACRDAVGLSKLVVAGGDTSAAVCRRLGAHAFRVLSDVAPGVPACEAIRPVTFDDDERDEAQGAPLLAVFKSGSFGGPGFVVDAVAHLQEVARCMR